VRPYFDHARGSVETAGRGDRDKRLQQAGSYANPPLERVLFGRPAAEAALEERRQ